MMYSSLQDLNVINALREPYLNERRMRIKYRKDSVNKLSNSV